MSVKVRILKNGTASILDKLGKVCEQLLLVPFFIMHWGVAYYGDWITLTILPSFLALSNLGFGTAVGNTFVLKYASGDRQGAANTIKTGLKVMHLGIIVLLLMSLGILEILNSMGVFSNLTISSLDAKWSVFFMFAAAVSTFYLAIFECFYRVVGQAHIGIFLQAVATFLKVGIGIVLLFMGANALGYAVLIFTTTVVVNIIYIFLSINFLKFQEYKTSNFDKKEAIFLFKKGFGYFLSPLWQAIYYQGTTFVIRIILGPTGVVLFNTVRTLINSSSQVFNIVVRAIYPEFHIAVGQNNKGKAKKLYSLIFLFNFIVSICFVIFFSLFGDWFYSWWTHNQLAVPTIVWMIMIARIVFYALWFSSASIFQAYNQPYPITITGVIISIISVVITWICSSLWGIVGAAIGILIFDVLMFLVLQIQSRRYLVISKADILASIRGINKKI
ncbi:hypothetical protein F4V57_10575 [Acinetobacter qingfengensis]|uniref:Uncharacterized protein n=1 Tax=Acinetobacter qingfengensis TaxID=1262585 RepID=A0A1E7RD08_9GAMM|nr:polysaccharide biosynthesis C-terminal domain-containing protein [Acinetobacter qingfengensis]KAA8732062.1 hypothetical protein F4V57_10575 [Acinetobacter qingfengensis]OEY97142.1 hypothetical protein BJI46_01555 [Acinetobacter qingfengensis]